MNKPSQANKEVFDDAVVRVAAIARELLTTMTTHSEPRDRAVEALRARLRAAKRYGPVTGSANSAGSDR
jgi:hypothetical protein